MMQRTFMVALLAAGLACGLAHADTLLTTKEHQDGFTVMGQTQPAKDSTQKMWVGKDRLRMDSEDGGMLVRADQKKLYIINHGEKKYSALDLPVDFKKLFPAEMAAMADQMLQMMKMEATVTPTAETRKINQWNCRRYDVAVKMAMTESKQSVWASPDVKFEFPAYELLTTVQFALSPSMEALAKEFKKIEGQHVLTETVTTVMGSSIKARTELVSVENKPAPAGTYEVPAGYTQEAFDFTKMGKD